VYTAVNFTRLCNAFGDPSGTFATWQRVRQALRFFLTLMPKRISFGEL